MARVKKLVKTFQWRDEDRVDVVLGTSTRINPETNRAQLLAASNGNYPTAANLFVKSKLTNPQAVRNWTGFEAKVAHKKNFQNVQVTGAQFRLSDGVTDFYWDGAAWSAAGVSDWNIEADVANNIATFSATARQLQVIVNLSTTDAAVTPELISVKVLYEAVIEFQEDIIFRSLIPLIRSTIRPISRSVFTMAATGTTFNISEAKLESGYNVVGIDSVFNFTTDPNRLTDLFSSYNPTTGGITLSSAVTLGQKIWVRFIYEPIVAVTTSQDFVNSETVPSIVLTDIALTGAVPAPSGEDSVVNKSTGDAVVVPSPLQGELGFTLLGLADKAIDNQRLLEAVNSFFANTNFVVSTGLDERYRLHVIDEYAAVGEPGQAEIHMGRATFQIRNFRQWLADAFDDKIVTNPIQLNLGST